MYCSKLSRCSSSARSPAERPSRWSRAIWKNAAASRVRAGADRLRGRGLACVRRARGVVAGSHRVVGEHRGLARLDLLQRVEQPGVQPRRRLRAGWCSPRPGGPARGGRPGRRGCGRAARCCRAGAASEGRPRAREARGRRAGPGPRPPAGAPRSPRARPRRSRASTASRTDAGSGRSGSFATSVTKNALPAGELVHPLGVERGAGDQLGTASTDSGSRCERGQALQPGEVAEQRSRRVRGSISWSR